jgi:hypothetical protein
MRQQILVKIGKIKDAMKIKEVKLQCNAQGRDSGWRDKSH